MSGYFLAQAKKDTTTSNPSVVSSLPIPKKINWKIDSVVEKNLEETLKEYNNFYNDHDYTLLFFRDYGSSWIKTLKMSPDSWAQMSLQLAFYKLYGKGVATYETAQTRQFYHGRTETCRSLSAESLEWTKAMTTDAPAQTKLNLLRKAIDSHKKYMSEAVAGKGIDRHMLGLRLVAGEDKTIKMPEIFTDQVYKESTNWRISTSNITQNGLVAGFGPVVNDGYGICYGVKSDLIHFSITSKHSCPLTNSQKMKEAIRTSLLEMQQLFNNPQAKL